MISDWHINKCNIKHIFISGGQSLIFPAVAFVFIELVWKYVWHHSGFSCLIEKRPEPHDVGIIITKIANRGSKKAGVGWDFLKSAWF
jgi:hypothetical protein